MNRRIRSIFWLMTLCIIGINVFQGYWLWTTYQIQRQQISRTMWDALYQRIQRQLAEANPKDTYPLAGRATAVGQSYQRTPGIQVFVAPDTSPRRISNRSMLDWAEGTRINLTELSAAFGTELHQRGISVCFKLDTGSVHPQKPPANVRVNQLDERSKQNDPPNVVNRIVVSVNSVPNLYVQASFETPTFYLLRQMGWLLGSSVFLLLLTTGCFLFMLSTILRQKKLSEVKNDFINNMTHELKTPIATVTAAVEALQHFGALNDPRKTQTYLTISQNNLKRLSDLVEKVLNLAVEEKRELLLRPEPIYLHDVVNELVASHQLKATKSVTFQINMPADIIVTVDRVHFGNTLNNLIDNAINYSSDRVTIQLTFQRNETGWQLTVADDGIGIAETYQSAIFDRFFRVPTGDLHPIKGFGLGLAYVRQVVERHGGRVSLRSEPGKGSEFMLTFS